MAKKPRIWPSKGQSKPLAAGAIAASESVVPAPFNILGGARTNQTRTPPSRNTQMISEAVTAVMAPLTRKIAHSRRSLPMFLVVSFQALSATMPMTEAPTP